MSEGVNELLQRDTLKISTVILGKSLNLWCLRGFAKLDELSAISLADIANDLTNQKAPQRSPDRKHAEAAFEYALGSMEEGLVRFFPEVILNVRDLNCITLHDNFGTIEMNSFDGPEREAREVALHFDLNKISREASNPSISTVDGNHRLVQALIAKREDPSLEFPMVSFSILVGLTSRDEAILFRDLNSKHKGMDSSHLTALGYDLDDQSVLLRHTSGQASWLAHQLSAEGQPFHNMVRRYSNRAVYKLNNKEMPPMTLQMLTTAFKNTLSKSDFIKNMLDPALNEVELMERAVIVKNGLSNYWTAVKTNFPEAWQDRKNYIFLKSIGIGAFSYLAGTLIDMSIEQDKTELDYLNKVLKHIANNIDLSVDNWKGVAGAGGTKLVYEAMYAAMQKDRYLTIAQGGWGEPSPSPLGN